MTELTANQIIDILDSDEQFINELSQYYTRLDRKKSNFKEFIKIGLLVNTLARHDIKYSDLDDETIEDLLKYIGFLEKI